MTKRLKSSTIISSELYVHRDADRQLRRVLDDMGRPGYVLVARQMGKTNLLLNARRELQTEADAFVYIDVSNVFGDQRQCFRNIVDSVVESNEPRFAALRSAIAAGRVGALPAHKEHELELKLLLERCPGRLVIILDEVDALTTSDFADQVFAQIRSTYFARANITSFERLTYVLSGVAEPSELIKNSKLSPFNIGEKIYLDDFTVGEFGEFVSRAGLDLSSDVREAIFGWVGGNPRMTWDVCSEIEDLTALGEPATADMVDEIVRKLYLTSFDRAPVDHIRTLAEQSSEIRNALVEMRYGKGSTVSDGVRARLYLAGITGSRAAPVRIKNAVIELALSEQWLKDVERQRMGLLKLAHEQAARGQHAEAVASYSEFLREGIVSELDRLDALNGRSVAQVAMGQYREAMVSLDEGMFDRSEYPALYFAQVSRKASCWLSLGEYQKSVDLFEEVLAGNAMVETKLQARVNLAGARLQLSGMSSEAILEYQSILRALDAIEWPNARARDTLRVAVCNNLASALIKDGRKDEAVLQLEAAATGASPAERSVLLVRMLDLVPTGERRHQIAVAAIDLIVTHELRPSAEARASDLALTMDHVGDLLSAAFEVPDRRDFRRLLQYCIGADIQANALLFSPVYVHLLAAVAVKGDSELAQVEQLISDTAVGAGPELRYFFAKVIAYYAVRGQRKPVGGEQYLAALSMVPRALDEIDARVLGVLVPEVISMREHVHALAILDGLEVHRSLSRREIFVAFDYYRLVLLGLMNDRDAELAVARGLALAFEQGLELDKRSRDVIREAIEAVLRGPPQAGTVLRTGRKYGRNDVVTVVYSDGTRRKVKYKRIESDLRTGVCTLEDA